MTAISPDQYQAMREWVRGRVTLSRNEVDSASNAAILAFVNGAYQGGVEAFLAKHPSSREDSTDG